MNDSTAIPPSDERAALRALQNLHQILLERIHARIVGQEAAIEALLTCLFSGGHALFIGVPGLAKTLLVESLAASLGLASNRIQFTPDLMPSDVTGSDILDIDAEGRRSFRFVAGPIFCNLLLADEINRTPPKTQAALLQAMQEHRVTANGNTYRLPAPFHVFATRNPIEQEGTYILPEAQLDRFTMQIRMGYPDLESERKIMGLSARNLPTIEPVLTAEVLGEFQDFIAQLPVAPSVLAHVVDLLRATRPEDAGCPASLKELIRWGVGPRAGQQLVAAARARAALRGRAAVEIDDVRALAVPVLEHRIVTSYRAQTQGIDSPQIIAMVLDQVRA